ncbi:hypothetical protein D3C72_1366450 [compost metagenome]
MQLLALALPSVLNLGRCAVVVQRVPGAGLQLLCPDHHRVIHRGPVVGHHVNGRCIDAQHHFDVVGIERHFTQRGVADEIFEVGQALGHGVNVRLRDRCRLGQKRIGQRVGQRLDLYVLCFAGHVHQRQPLAQALQQPRQVLNHLRAITPVGLGTRGPHQVCRGAFERDGVRMLRSVAHC